MNAQTTEGEAQRVSRRTVLKATAASAVGGAVFASTAGAVSDPAQKRINFCGCSQVCLTAGRIDTDVPVTIWVASTNDGAYSFETERRTLTLGDLTCYEVEDGKKIIAVEKIVDGTSQWWGNPSPCAAKALDAWSEDPDFENRTNGALHYGTFGDVELLRSNCGFTPSGGAHPGRHGA